MAETRDRPWADVTAAILRRFDIAAQFDGKAVWNAKGSAACAKIIREMARIIDDEIERRAARPAAKDESHGD